MCCVDGTPNKYVTIQHDAPVQLSIYIPPQKDRLSSHLSETSKIVALYTLDFSFHIGEWETNDSDVKSRVAVS